MPDLTLTNTVPQSRRVKLLAILAVAAVALVIVGPLFLDRFALNVLTRSMIFAILAITVDLLWGYTGILTFGQAAFFGAGAYVTAMLLTHVGSNPALLALGLVLSIVVPMLIGGAVGWLTFYPGSSDFYATIISLVVPIVITQLIYSGGTWTGSSSGLVGYWGINLGLDGYFRLAGLSLVAIAVAALVFVRSDAGRILTAIRNNEMRCAYLGINTNRIKILLTAILGGVAGFAGYLYANASGVVAPENAGFIFGTELVVWTALGGRGTIVGPVVGAIGIGYLSAQLSGDLPFLWQLLIGTLFVVMIIFLPNGLAALATGFRERARAGTAPRLVAEAPARPHRESDAPLLDIRNLEKSYGSQKVLEDITLSVQPGELVSLVGPNGAGKTTLMRCMTDGAAASGGIVRINGESIAGMVPNQIVARGIGRKFQVASVFESLTVAECLRMARTTLDAPSIVKTSDVLGLPQTAIDILRLSGLDQMLGTSVSLLSHGQKQSLELVMVVSLEPELILLDEPTAGLTKTERTTIGEVLKTLTAECGIAAILVEHDLDFVRDISSRIVVLHQGRLVLDGTVEDVVNDDIVKKIYSGGGHE
ncbi:ABC transporter permease subunit [Antarctobacter heliothermus]|uniref:Branched-chain amino acid transport system permease protein n=1 Tax=Antarctobacter heliothermus TaxID=74033 RepID=A0A239B431_9RHOB|nr:ATP-binding cassette domain-containing protein [Antarctobacter heliothermus]SNS01964.1 branched-chain amino acid transport system permease protein [Antarctobacter heliothermus]